MRTESLINLGLLKDTLKRFWPLGLIYIVVLAMVFVAPVSTATFDAAALADPTEASAAILSIWKLAFLEAVAIAFAAALIVAVYMNDHLFKSSAATFAASLPLRRRTLFATSFAAGLAVLVAVPLVAFAFLLCMHFAAPILPLKYAAEWLALTVAVSFAFYAIALACCQLSGTQYAAAILYFVVNFLAVCISGALWLMVSALQYGSSGWGEGSVWLSPFVGILTHGFRDDYPFSTIANWPVIVGYCIVGVAFLVMACVLNYRRDYERAGEPVVFAPARVVLKYLAGISAALLFGALCCLYFRGNITEGMPVSGAKALVMFAMAALGGFLGLVFSDMLMSKATRVFGKCWRGGVALAVASAALVGGVYTDALGFTRPPDAGQVKSASVEVEDISTSFASDGGIRTVVELQQQVIDYGANDLVASDSVSYETVAFDYVLANGKTVKRSYVVATGSSGEDGEFAFDDAGMALLRAMQQALDTPEGRFARFGELVAGGNDSLAYEVVIYTNEGEDETHTLRPSDEADFIEHALKPDFAQGRAGDIGRLWPFNHADDRSTELSVILNILRADGSCVRSVWLDTKYTPNTIAWLAKRYPGIDASVWKPAGQETVEG